MRVAGKRILAIALAWGWLSGAGSAASAPAWSPPDINALPDDPRGQLIRDGRDLIVSTDARIGPGAKEPARRFAGNHLACQSCHLEAGTKQFGLPLVGVFGDFPQYRAREGHVGTIQDRVNGCMTRSLNGKPLPDRSREMRAIVAYVAFLSAGPPQEGRGAGALAELTRPADPERGRGIYRQVCAACHGPDGQGEVSHDAVRSYAYPPLWGRDSFNDGAGMNRLIAAANFIHSNMPNGASWTAPAMPDEDSWDVAAYMISQERPHKMSLDRDYPRRLEKPADAAYPPFADGFDPEQHRFGPFAAIRARMRASAGSDEPLAQPATP